MPLLAKRSPQQGKQDKEVRASKRKVPPTPVTDNKKPKVKTPEEREQEFYKECEEALIRQHTRDLQKRKKPPLLHQPILDDSGSTTSTDDHLFATQSQSQDLPANQQALGQSAANSMSSSEGIPLVESDSDVFGTNGVMPSQSFSEHRGNRMSTGSDSIDIARQSDSGHEATAPLMTQISKLLDAKFTTVASKTDIQIVITDIEGVTTQVAHIKEQVESNTENIAHLKSAVSRLQQRGSDGSATPVTVDLISPSKRTPRLGMGRPGLNHPSIAQLSTPHRPPFLTGASCYDQDQVRRSRFDEARRSIRIWPIIGVDEAEMMKSLCSFLSGALLHSEQEIGFLAIEKVRRVRTQPGGLVHHEVRVTFAHLTATDHIATKGTMLAKYTDPEGKPTAGIRIDVPDYLAHDFKLLDSYGKRMRRIHGKETKKYVKYDDARISLLLELRLPGEESWIKITPDIVRELDSSSDREEIDRNRKKLTARRLLQPQAHSANFVPLGEQRPSRRTIDPLPSGPSSVTASPSPSTSSSGSGSTASGHRVGPLLAPPVLQRPQQHDRQTWIPPTNT